MIEEFVEIEDTKHAGFAAAMEIYADAFPANTRFEVDLLRERIDKRLSCLYLGYLEDEEVLMALLWPLKNTEFILLDYIATKKKYRGQGIGTAFMNQINQMLRERNKFMLIEVANPEYGSNREQKHRRVAFYQQVGAKVMQGVRYVVPPLDGSSMITEMLLMVFPEYKDDTIAAKIVKEAIVQIYRELYHRDRDDPVLNDFIHDIQDPIFLV